MGWREARNPPVFLTGGAIRFAIAPRFRIRLSNSHAPSPAYRGARAAPSSLPVPPEKMRGAERRQALVRNAAPVVRLAAGPISGSPEMTAGYAARCASRRSAAALARSFRVLAQLRAALPPAIRPGLQRAPRAGVIVPPGRVPKPPECPADEAEPAGAAQAGPAFAPRQPRDRLADLRPRLPLAPSIRRHRFDVPR